MKMKKYTRDHHLATRYPALNQAKSFAYAKPCMDLNRPDADGTSYYARYLTMQDSFDPIKKKHSSIVTTPTAISLSPSHGSTT